MKRRDFLKTVPLAAAPLVLTGAFVPQEPPKTAEQPKVEVDETKNFTGKFVHCKNAVFELLNEKAKFMYENWKNLRDNWEGKSCCESIYPYIFGLELHQMVCLPTTAIIYKWDVPERFLHDQDHHKIGLKLNFISKYPDDILKWDKMDEKFQSENSFHMVSREMIITDEIDFGEDQSCLPKSVMKELNANLKIPEDIDYRKEFILGELNEKYPEEIPFTLSLREAMTRQISVS